MNVLRAQPELKIARFRRTGRKSAPKTNNSKPSRTLFWNTLESELDATYSYSR